jgi:hypothetical protein
MSITDRERADAARAASIYAQLAHHIWYSRCEVAPSWRQLAAEVLEAGGTPERASAIKEKADRLEADPLGFLLGRTNIGMLASTPHNWPYTMREFRPSSRPEDLIARAMEHLDRALGPRPHPEIDATDTAAPHAGGENDNARVANGNGQLAEGT